LISLNAFFAKDLFSCETNSEIVAFGHHPRKSSGIEIGKSNEIIE